MDEEREGRNIRESEEEQQNEKDTEGQSFKGHGRDEDDTEGQSVKGHFKQEESDDTEGQAYKGHI